MCHRVRLQLVFDVETTQQRAKFQVKYWLLLNREKFACTFSGRSRHLDDIVAVRMLVFNRMTLTRICYTASVNGKQLVPGRDQAPISNEALANETIVRKDALYSLVFYGAPAREIIVRLVQNLDALWEKTLGLKPFMTKRHVYVSLIDA